MNRKAWYIMLLLMGLQALTHWNKWDLGPRGVHVWRQCNTLATARNFHQEDMDLFHPRVDHRKDTDGVTGMPMPIFEFVLAQVYRMTGPEDWPHRLLQFIVFQIGSIGLFRILLKQFGRLWIAVPVLLMYMWSPELYYHSLNALPDISAMSLVIWSTHLYLQDKRRFSTLFAVLLVCVAGLIKLQFLMFGFLFAVHALYHRRTDELLALVLFGFVGTGAVANWYIYSLHLRFTNQLHDYGLFLNPADSIWNFARIVYSNLSMDFPEQLIGYGALIPALLGFWVYLRHASMRKLAYTAMALAPFVAFYLLELKQMVSHAYYLMPFILLSSYFIALGFERIKGKWATFGVVLLCVVQVAHSLNKIQARYSDAHAGIPVEFLDESQRAALLEATGHSHRAVVGPDGSACIYFYYLGVKGWSIADMEQLERKDEVRMAIEAGQVDCLVVEGMDEQRKSLYSQQFPWVQEIGNFTVLRRAIP